MNISNSLDGQKGNVPDANALLIRVKTKLPNPIKDKIKKMGAIWLEAYQGYGISLAQKASLQKALDPWKTHISFSEIFVDPSIFSQPEKFLTTTSLKYRFWKSSSFPRQ